MEPENSSLAFHRPPTLPAYDVGQVTSCSGAETNMATEFFNAHPNERR